MNVHVSIVYLPWSHTLPVPCTSKVRTVIAIDYHTGGRVWSLGVAAL